ncbi:MAG: hypothetical protein LVQ95_01320 [Candidatus Micrarchaeales archaeon]|nr:hypothetical protein [Candidatus Micrarchaeales archaeon]
MSAIAYVKDRRIITLIVVVLLLAALDLVYGLHFGIEFNGGTQIPVTLEHSVNVTTMSTLISALDQRLSTFGLEQITIEGVGDSLLYITVPTASSAQINQTINIIESQGRFDGVVGGREAINGSGILRDSIGEVPPQVYNNTVTWQVNFYITAAAERPFADAAFGQANKPIYLFLDRPTRTAILINSSWLGSAQLKKTPAQELSDMQGVLALGNQTIPVLSVSNTNSSMLYVKNYFSSNSSKAKYSTILASANLNQSLLSFLIANNYTVKLESMANMTPSYIPYTFNYSGVDAWPMVGLITAPTLSPALTNGNITNSFEINGQAPLNLTASQKLAYASNESKKIASVLSGGALPVAVIPGTPTTIPPTLGTHFLYISGIAGLIAIVLVSIFMVIRYRKAFLVVPILLTTAMELFIIVSIIGLVGTIDLAAVAGMIAVIGTGVDAQVIITDEIIARKVDLSAKALLGNAFYIVWADAALLVIAMLPLFLSTSLVTVIGFSEATIFGALLSVFVTRPAYGAIISKRYA